MTLNYKNFPDSALEQILQVFTAEKTRESERKQIDAEMERQLRSLGYIQ